MSEHWFWTGVVAASVLWYSLVTLRVAARGARDVRSLLDQLRR